jgi:effector-binding domain-containing protein
MTSAAGNNMLRVAMTYEVRIEHADARTLAGIRVTTSGQELSSAIIGSLDRIWPTLKRQGVLTGHNVVIYRSGDAQSLIIDVGVEVLGDFATEGDVKPTSTPSGLAAATAHYGEYSELGRAYAALERWCSDNRRQRTGVNWEVYGDWADDPAELRTDVYFGLVEEAAH